MTGHALRRRPLAALARCQDGASIVEFAIVLPVLLFLLLSIIEVMITLFIDSALESGVRSAARYGSTGYVPSGTSRAAHIMDMISARSLGLANVGNTTVTMRVYSDFASLQAGGPGATGSPGGANDVVVYTATYRAPYWTPLATVAGTDGQWTLSATTVVRNEPYDDSEAK